MKTVTLEIEGMRCEGCARTIEALLGKEAGVEKVVVSFNDRRARILYDAKAIGAQPLEQLIERAGYKVLAKQA